MKHHGLLFCTSLSLILSGCSTHLLPDDVTPDNTIEIVHKIRCEAKYALQDELINVLDDLADDRRNNDTKLRLLNDKKFDIGKVEDFMVDQRVHKIVDPFKDEQIGFTFIFTMTELNNGSGEAKFALPFTNGAFNVSVNGGTDLTRKNLRTLQMSESWWQIVKQDCKDFTATHANRIYPITGKVGLAEVVHTYLQFIHLGGVLGKRGQKFSEKLTFTTKISGGVKPVLELKPVSDKLKLVNANGNFGASRSDEHEVLIVISRPPDTEDLKIKLADNVTLTVKAQKGKYAQPKNSVGTKSSKRFLIEEPDADTAAQAREQMLNEMNRLQSIDTQRQILDAIQ